MRQNGVKPPDFAQPPHRKAKRVLRGVLAALAFVGLALCVAVYVLLYTSPVPANSTYDLDLARVRQLAQGSGEPLPVRLNALVVAESVVPQITVVAGGSFRPQRMAFSSFQVVYTDSTIVIDAVHDQATHSAQFPDEPYDPAGFEAMQVAMRESRTILVTHEHFDHVAGIPQSPYLGEIIGKVMMTTEQVDHAGPETGFTPDTLGRLTVLDYDGAYAVAPGVVLIEAAGHSPGSQMIYVRLQNGVEYLLVGDVVWGSVNLDRLTGRSLLSSLALGEDREATAHQIRALYEVRQSEPINLVISHDGDQIERYIQRGLIGNGFESITDHPTN
jgi:glyoxylase-like metal-dependent hydrolase (beta-lactamase superfamily II)